MKVSAWLVIEMRNRNNWSGRIDPVITKVRQTRPTNDMAVKITLDIEPEDLQPHVDALLESGYIVLRIEDPAEDTDE